MFTGLIEEIGTIESITQSSKSSQIKIKAQRVLEDVKFGDSIATNGVCLTVSSFDKRTFTADVMPATMVATTLSRLKKGSKVNLERALRMGDRFGGHIVSGHIDSTGIIESYNVDENATWISIKPSTELMKYLLPKGSIAIDGVSLTIAELNDKNFKVSIIPVTKEDTTLLQKQVGDLVNLEGDVIGKYIERLMLFKGKENETQEANERDQEEAYNQSLNFLRDNGFA